MTGASEPLDFLYPPAETHAGGLLDVWDGHAIWWETSGAPDGRPVLLLHGGPGAPTVPLHRRFFDPRHYRLVVLHQRGCGRSVPLAETAGNTTAALIADIEALRTHLGIARWLVTGGSWGSCLAIAYGEAHPDRCEGFCLTGITLGRPQDIDWWWNGTRKIFPEAWDRLMDRLPAALHDDPMAGFHRLIMDPDPAISGEAARHLCLYSAETVGGRPDPKAAEHYGDLSVSLPLARLFLHYNRNRFFLEPDQLLRHIDRIAALPCAIVSGRHDMTTAAEAAWTLHKAWPGSTITFVEGAGHRLNHPDLARAFLLGLESMKAWPSLGS